MPYWKFAAMIATSTVVMFILMYLNTYLLSHIFWSETRAYMALLMGATMAIIMLGFMLTMYSSRAINASILIGATIVFAGSLWLVRSQTTVGDTSYMRAMIPHHSIAIMTSSRANIENARVRKLADEIIFAQDKEIAEMRYLIDDIEAVGKSSEEDGNGPAEIVSLQDALSTAEVAILDPEFMTEQEIVQLFPDGAACTFNYTKTSPASLAVGNVGGATTALVKLSGDLIRLETDGSGRTLTADGITMRLSVPNENGNFDTAGGEPAEADLVLELDAGLRAGYRGYHKCEA
ncbi:DUF305 domain-containing protein [Roseovarius pelagicus]|uniref:DUF305 domain-containing protein n=1 Tax=Roseovarius pelagicus TaxID=2980108 RepID=A0ABY6DGI5_9RHOB|nr:DUF305 domain-containing protein [Roseovarius pelagicus]UXX85274.1 DUF305 domain-containing protein [Roseovarius pelagicus]